MGKKESEKKAKKKKKSEEKKFLKNMGMRKKIKRRDEEIGKKGGVRI